ncbi:MAG: hypothetical protein Q9175_007412, partial [Cornicularia normoerica]
MATNTCDGSSDPCTATSHEKLLDANGNSKENILIAIHPEDIENIITRVKTYDFRKYHVSNHVKEFWYYQTAPISAVTHVAVVGHAKRPGEITGEGLKNHEFNTNTNVETREKFAYPIEELWKLSDPVTLKDMINSGWEIGHPMKYCFVHRDMVETMTI